jgi:hypothetical protein
MKLKSRHLAITLVSLLFCSTVYSAVPQTAQYCKSIQDKALSILADHKNSNFSQQLIEYSRSHPIDNQCFRWQLVILKNLSSLALQPEGYRDYLFERLNNEDSEEMVEFMLHSLNYSAETGPLTEEEWRVIKSFLINVDEAVVQSIILGLVINRFENNESLQAHMADVFDLAKNKLLGSKEKVSLSRAIEIFLKLTAEQRPELFSIFYQKYYYLLDQESYASLSNQAVRFFNNNQNEFGLNFLSVYIGHSRMSDQQNRKFFLLLLKLHKEKNNNPFYKQVVNNIVDNYPEKVRQIIDNAKLSKRSKDLLKIEYQLDHPGEYQIMDYAQQLFSAKLRQQQLAADYLIAFNQRAVIVENDAASKLFSIIQEYPNNSSSKLITSLLKILTNVGSNDQSTVEMMLWALDSRDNKISEQAYIGLKAIGSAALPEYSNNFKSYSIKVQHLVVDIMGSFDDGRLPAIKFLSEIKPRNDKIRFAVDQAVAELNDF